MFVPLLQRLLFFVDKVLFYPFSCKQNATQGCIQRQSSPQFCSSSHPKKPSIPPRNPQKPQTSLKTFPPTPSHLIWDSPIHQDGHSKARFLLKSEQVIFISFPPRLKARSPFCIIIPRSRVRRPTPKKGRHPPLFATQ